jgi:transposase
MARKPSPSDVSADEWALVAPYLTWMTEEAPQREHPLREVFNGLRWIVRAGAPWRRVPNDLPPWEAVYQPTQRWLQAGVFEAMVNDWRQLLGVAAGSKEQPSAVILDSRTLPSSPERGARAGYEGATRRKGRKTHRAGDTLGHLLALLVTPASAQDREEVAQVAQQVQAITDQAGEVALVDQGSTGEQPLEAAAAQGIRLAVIKVPQAKQGCVLLPRRWVVERDCAWMARFRRLARDYERLPQTLAGLHFLAFAILLLHRFIHRMAPCL